MYCDDFKLNFQTTLTKRLGSSVSDATNGKWWDVLEYHAVAQTVKIVADTVYATHNNGFVEVEFYGKAWSKYCG